MIIKENSDNWGLLYQASGVPPKAWMIWFMIPVSEGLKTKVVIWLEMTAETKVGQNKRVSQTFWP